MDEFNKMDRTWLCSVVFMDIVKYSSQSVEQQIKWKSRFNGYLAEAIQDVPQSERVILDTGDGAAICFLGAPEAAMFAALQLCRCFVLDEREQQPGMRVRMGINLGPVKLMKDINGAVNAIGDGINAGQRIMSFAAENQILVSQSFFEVVSRLSDDYKKLFQLKGVEKDKHVREHTVYHLTQPGAEKPEAAVASADAQAAPSTPETNVPAAAGAKGQSPWGRSIPWMIAGVAVVALAAVGVWHFRRASVPAATSSMNSTASGQNQSSSPSAAPAASAIATTPSAGEAPRPDKSPSAARPAESPGPAATTAPKASARAENSPASPPPSQPPSQPSRADSEVIPPSADAQAAYEEGSQLLDQNKPADAVQHFDDAIKSSPAYLNAYVGRAEARRRVGQYALSMEDCNKIIQIKADDPRGYNCRAQGYALMKEYDSALLDFNEALRLNPNFGLAYLKRASTYESLKQYDKAIQDYTELIRLEPTNLKAYMGRASAEEASGDRPAAMADRRRAQELRKNRTAE